MAGPVAFVILSHFKALVGLEFSIYPRLALNALASCLHLLTAARTSHCLPHPLLTWHHALSIPSQYVTTSFSSLFRPKQTKQNKNTLDQACLCCFKVYVLYPATAPRVASECTPDLTTLHHIISSHRPTSFTWVCPRKQPLPESQALLPHSACWS